MNGWDLITLLAALFNTLMLLYWQKANETRLDMHRDSISDLFEERERRKKGK